MVASDVKFTQPVESGESRTHAKPAVHSIASEPSNGVEMSTLAFSRLWQMHSSLLRIHTRHSSTEFAAANNLDEKLAFQDPPSMVFIDLEPASLLAAWSCVAQVQVPGITG